MHLQAYDHIVTLAYDNVNWKMSRMWGGISALVPKPIWHLTNPVSYQMEAVRNQIRFDDLFEWVLFSKHG